MAFSPTVHIIDDDEAVRDSLSVLLEAHGLASAAYSSVRAFLERPDIAPGDCIVTDVMMPEMDGLALLKALQDRPDAPPAIVIAGRGGRALASEALGLGAFAVIDKPFAADALLKAVRTALARAHAAQG